VFVDKPIPGGAGGHCLVERTASRRAVLIVGRVIFRRGGVRWTPKLAIVMTVAVIAVGVGLPLGLLSVSGTAIGGDPGGAILRELLATKSAIPPGSQPSTHIAQEPSWIGSLRGVR